MRTAALIAIVVIAAAPTGGAAEPDELKTSALAQAFGAAAVMWNVQLSPDGTRLSAIQMHPTGVTIARVINLVTHRVDIVLSGDEDDFEIVWCDWANDERLLCGLRALLRNEGSYYPVTRLVAAAADGSGVKVLLERKLSGTFAQYQDRVVDWLPDDAQHVLVQIPSAYGSGVSRVDIYSGLLSTEVSERNDARVWISDGHGTPRLYQSITDEARRWFVRETSESSWTLLRETLLRDLSDEFSPIGFGESRNELLFYDSYEGRTALFALDLAAGGTQRLVYAHPEFDVAGVHSLGKYERFVAATYADDRSHLHFFDQRIAAIHKTVATLFPDKGVTIIDESWDQRYYLMFVNGATDPGAYYRYDSEANVLLKIAPAYPALAERPLAAVTAIKYPAADGTEIPAYLTLPPNRSGPVPTVILPHGGPSARDYWTYDFLAQYLAANGYAVLQSNYRGSDGYGSAWLGDGGFRDWRRAVGDITAGTEHLIAEGIADPKRICAVGWSYGGYAALLSVIENQDMYRCVVSIAGVTNPKGLSNSMRRFIGGRSAQEFIGTDDEVQEAGSPLERVGEVNVPVLLVHAEQDVNVPFQQSSGFARALARADKAFEFIEYEHAEHDIAPERYRIDLLTRLGEFLGEHIGP